VIQVLSSLAMHSLALVVYPGLITVLALGVTAELAWTRAAVDRLSWRVMLMRRPTPVQATVAVCSILAAVQVAAPFNPVPTEERSVVIAAIALAFTAWAELALTIEHVPEPGLLLIVQFCWLLAVLGPAVQPESLRPQVLGNMLVPGLLPVKAACGFLYVLCLPALLRLWPVADPVDRRAKRRVDLPRALCWFPYTALFTTLFFPPSADDLGGLARFFGLTLAVTAIVMVMGLLLGRRGATMTRGFYARVVPPYAALVLLLVVATSVLMR
jgi:hypothetical protein